MSRESPSLVAAMQRALAIEHEAIYGYGVVGAHLSDARGSTNGPPTAPEVQQRLQQHQELRDRIAALLQRNGATPTPAAVGYELPFPVTRPASAARLALRLEVSGASAAYDVIAASAAGSPERGVMVAALTAAADWESRWSRWTALGPYAVPFPGRPDQPG